MTSHPSSSEGKSIYSWLELPHWKAGWKVCHHRKGARRNNRSNRETGAHFLSVSSKGIHGFALVCRHKREMEVVVWRMKNESSRERFKPTLLSHLSTPGQSLHKVGLIVELLVLERYQNCPIRPPKSYAGKVSDAAWQSNKHFVWNILTPTDCARFHQDCLIPLQTKIDAIRTIWKDVKIIYKFYTQLLWTQMYHRTT